MNRFRIRFLDRGRWLATVLVAADEEDARVLFWHKNPRAIILGLTRECGEAEPMPRAG